MPANQCPRCGQPVMAYGRFFREAEPYKTSPCGSCGAKLRRGKGVYVLLLIMSLLAMAGALGCMLWQVAFWLRLTFVVSFVAIWVVITNYLGWRLVGWVPADE